MHKRINRLAERKRQNKSCIQKVAHLRSYAIKSDAKQLLVAECWKWGNTRSNSTKERSSTGKEVLFCWWRHSVPARVRPRTDRQTDTRLPACQACALHRVHLSEQPEWQRHAAPPPKPRPSGEAKRWIIACSTAARDCEPKIPTFLPTRVSTSNPNSTSPTSRSTQKHSAFPGFSRRRLGDCAT